MVKDEVSKPDVIGNEITFPVREKKLRGRPLNIKKLVRLLLTGYFVIVGIVMGIRLSFFINAGFAEGVVTGIIPSPRGYSFYPRVTFSDNSGLKTTFTGTQNLRLKTGEKVKVIYKKNNPERAVIYSFFGFWFNAVLICQVALFFWVGFLVVYYGDYP